MSPLTEPSTRTPRRITPVGYVAFGMAFVILMLLCLPSAKQRRIIIAKEYLATEFPIVPDASMTSLLSSHLITDGKFIYDAGRKECAILVFTPDSATTYYTAGTMLTEASSPLQYYYSSDTYWERVPVAILLAPEDRTPGWTIFAKVWIAKVLQKQKVKDLQSLGLELSSSSKLISRIEKIWAKMPSKIKVRATQILEENRKVARQYIKTPRFYRKEATYAISEDHDMSDFIVSYIKAHPERFPNLEF